MKVYVDDGFSMRPQTINRARGHKLQRGLLVWCKEGCSQGPTCLRMAKSALRETSSLALKYLIRNCKNISGVVMNKEPGHISIFQMPFILKPGKLLSYKTYNSLIYKREKHGYSDHTGVQGQIPACQHLFFPHRSFSSSQCGPMELLENLGSPLPASCGLWKFQFHSSPHLGQLWSTENGTGCRELVSPNRSAGSWTEVSLLSSRLLLPAMARTQVHLPHGSLGPAPKAVDPRFGHLWPSKVTHPSCTPRSWALHTQGEPLGWQPCRSVNTRFWAGNFKSNWFLRCFSALKSPAFVLKWWRWWKG